MRAVAPPPQHGGDVQRQPVIGGVNWQIQYESRARSLSSSTGEAGSLNREWILFMLPEPLNYKLASHKNITMLFRPMTRRRVLGGVAVKTAPTETKETETGPDI